jgi:hypothetical protein
MVGGPQKSHKAGLGKDNSRIMRGQTVPGLREELADRTQQRIVSMAAWDGGRLGDSRSTCRVLEESAGALRYGYCPLFYEDLPAVPHNQGKLHRDDEQAQQRLQAAQDWTTRLPGSVALGAIPLILGDQRGFPLAQKLC